MLGLGLGMTSVPVLAPFGARLIPTLGGTQYGTLDTVVNFAGDFEVEAEFATVSTNINMALYADTTASTNYLTVSPTAIGYGVRGSTGSYAGLSAINDGKVHTIKATVTGTTLEVFLDGVSLGTNVVAAPTSTAIEFIGKGSGAANYFIDQILSTKFTDIATGDIRNFIFDSGSDTEQYTRGSTTDKITLINFATTDWFRYTQQRNIVHDAGIIPLAWVGDNVVINGRFDADTDWTKGAGWTIGGGVADNDGTNTTYKAILQSGIVNTGDIYLSKFDLVSMLGVSNFEIHFSLFNTWLGTSDSLGSKTLVGAANAIDVVIGSNGNGAGGSVDNVSVQKLLEVA